MTFNMITGDQITTTPRLFTIGVQTDKSDNDSFDYTQTRELQITHFLFSLFLVPTFQFLTDS